MQIVESLSLLFVLFVPDVQELFLCMQETHFWVQI